MNVTYGKGFAPVRTMRRKVERLEAELMHLPQVACEITHHFVPGLYARRVFLKAGTVCTGAIHKTEHLIVIAAGRVEVVTETGTQTYEAGDIITCHQGMKNAVYALEDSVWANFFPVTETDPDKLVSLLTESTADELIGGASNQQALCNASKELE